MRQGEIGKVLLVVVSALACSSKSGGGIPAKGGATGGSTTAGGGSTTAGGGSTTAGGGSTTAGGGSTTASDGPTGTGGAGGSGSGGKDAPGSQGGSSACGTLAWTKTSWSENSDYFRLYAGPDRVLARTWDVTNGGRTFLTSDNGATWTLIGSADSDMDVLSAVMSKDKVLAGTWNDLCQSDASGTSLSIVTPTGMPADTAIWSLASSDTALLAGTRENVYRSSDQGATWNEVKSGIPADTIVTAILAADSGVLAGTDSHGVLAMSSAGTSWATGDSVLANAYVNQIVALGSRLFAVTPDGVFLSDDSGSTWKPDASGLSDVNCLLVVDDRLWAGTDDRGVYLSMDTGVTWAPVRAGMPDGTRVWSLAATNETIFAGTNTGVWRTPCRR